MDYTKLDKLAHKLDQDNTNPEYYKSGKIECIDAIEVAIQDLQGASALCVGNVIKYVWRYKNKNGVEDLKKARWYIDRLIQLEEEEENNAKG